MGGCPAEWQDGGDNSGNTGSVGSLHDAVAGQKPLKTVLTQAPSWASLVAQMVKNPLAMQET